MLGGLGKGGVGGLCVDSRLCWWDWVNGEWGDCVLTADWTKGGVGELCVDSRLCWVDWVKGGSWGVV